MTKQKLLILGLPRSGTTIISNYINSDPDIFIFIEPHWKVKFNKTKDIFLEPELRQFKNLKYKRFQKLPLDKSIQNMLTTYGSVGFKETFRSIAYKNINPQIVNQKLLEKYKQANYQIIPIIRDPLKIWNSFKSFNPKDGSWSADLLLFLQNYQDFFKFIPTKNSIIIYESFIKNPNKALSKLSIKIYTSDIKKRSIYIGDELANKSEKIKSIKKPIFYTKHDKKIIESSQSMKMYKHYLKNDKS